MRSMGRIRMRSASICEESADWMPVEEVRAEARTASRLPHYPDKAKIQPREHGFVFFLFSLYPPRSLW
jgi:hypothetical protein